MSMGLAWDERLPGDSPANDERAMDEAAEPYPVRPQRPVEVLPGRHFQYCGGAPTLFKAPSRGRLARRLTCWRRKLCSSRWASTMLSGFASRTATRKALVACDWGEPATSLRSASSCSMEDSGEATKSFLAAGSRKFDGCAYQRRRYSLLRLSMVARTRIAQPTGAPLGCRTGQWRPATIHPARVGPRGSNIFRCLFCCTPRRRDCAQTLCAPSCHRVRVHCAFR